MINVVLHRVLLKREVPVDTNAVKTKNELSRLGLAIPESYKEDMELKALRENASMDKGYVVAIGQTAFKDYGIECPIKIGDYISFAKFGGKEITDPEDGEVYVVINDEDVVAILKKEPLDG
jgi:co-chaperonin GroES (HSP10)